ncbi:hypothetical protein K461DRAFT_297501 [Myriangium duriaei CBS 260.36]|uniref:Uncharacterized protein n=1 Tax=Myriangium duriaei CBS 260.36 TaxID=1168546 RepID=A0A9P4IV64_9PEZI|nr:hypothetical protein K461DRAFT_297501 [Myriangium duriaei CBS 260.36]
MTPTEEEAKQAAELVAAIFYTCEVPYAFFNGFAIMLRACNQPPFEIEVAVQGVDFHFPNAIATLSLCRWMMVPDVEQAPSGVEVFVDMSFVGLVGHVLNASTHAAI